MALTSWPGGTDGFRLADALYGAVAGCGFGLLFIALDQAGTSAGAWPLLPGQVVALLVVSAVAVPEIVRLVRAHRPIRLSTAIRWGLAAGVFGATANLMFLLATGAGQLTVAAVLAGLYPAVTVALAAIVLHERIQRVQATGLIAAAAPSSLSSRPPEVDRIASEHSGGTLQGVVESAASRPLAGTHVPHDDVQERCCGGCVRLLHGSRRRPGPGPRDRVPERQIADRRSQSPAETTRAYTAEEMQRIMQKLP